MVKVFGLKICNMIVLPLLTCAFGLSLNPIPPLNTALYEGSEIKNNIKSNK